jgi:SOS-response transcriptional repressor LexA
MATEYGSRLKKARNHAGMTQMQASAKTGIPQSTISTAEREGHGSGDTPVYAKTYGVDAHWLATGEGEMLPSHDLIREAANISPGPDIKGRGSYPVLTDIQAGNWKELCGTFGYGESEVWKTSPHNLGPCGYFLRVEGASMTNPGADISFPEGMLLHVNPDEEALPGRFVVVRRETEKAATFKKLTIVDGEPYLEAINPNWPNRYLKLKPGDVICGVVVDASYGRLI